MVKEEPGHVLKLRCQAWKAKNGVAKIAHVYRRENVRLKRTREVLKNLRTEVFFGNFCGLFICYQTAPVLLVGIPK